MQTVHIDTSIQIERFKAFQKAQIVEDALKVFGFKSTSSYSKLEFKRVWLKRLAYLYSATEKVNRTDELIGYITDHLGSHPGHRRKLCTSLQAIQSFLSKINEALSPEAQLIRLRIHLRNAILGSYDLWDSSITYEYNGSGV